MDRLQRIIGGRSIGLLLHGASVKAMETGIQEVGYGDMCWASLNYFTLLEKQILGRIGDRLSIIAMFSEQSLARRHKDIIQFLKRPEDNLLITSSFILNNIPDYQTFIRLFRDKIYLTEGLPVPWEAERKANSVALLLNELVASGVNKINIFGMDGIGKGPTAMQEKQSYCYSPTIFQPGRFTSIRKDTVDFNKAFPKVLAYWKARNFSPEIINYNQQSYIKVFPRRKWMYENWDWGIVLCAATALSNSTLFNAVCT